MPCYGSMTRLYLALEVSADCVIYGFEKGEQVPVIGWKTHEQKKTPAREQRAGILRMLAERKWKLSAPGNFIAKSIAVKHPYFAQPIKHACAERLPSDDQCRTQAKGQEVAVEWQEGSIAKKITPTDKHRALQ